MKRYIMTLGTILVLFPASVKGQQVLTLEEAITMGLSNNHDVQLVRNDQRVLDNSATRGNAGMLPSLQFTAAASKSSSNINQKFSTGLEVSRNGVGSGNFNSGLGLSWTLFDGFKMFVTYKKLQEMALQGEMQVRQQMENTVLDITAAYYSIAREEQKRKTIVTLMEIYRERLAIAQTRMDIGNGNMADVLQARLELNEQLSAEAKQNTLIANAKSVLNTIIGSDVNHDFTIDSLQVPEIGDIEAYRKQMETGNISLKIASSQMLQADYFLREVKSFYYPKLGVGLNYNWSRNTSEAGFALLNQNMGFTYGVNLSWNIFNGFQQKNAVDNASIIRYSAELNYYREKKRNQESLQQAYNRFAESWKLIEIEKESVSLAQQYVNIMVQRFKLAQSTSLELKDAQNSYLQAQIRLIEAQYNAKIAHTEIKRLEGSLM